MTFPINPIAHTGLIRNGVERRSNERTTTNIHAILRFQDKLKVVQGSVCDLSVGGSGFMCQQAVAAGSKCTLQFELPALNQARGPSVTLPVTVVNTMQVVGQASQFRVNLRFANLPPSIQNHIVAFIQQSLGRH